MGLNVIQHQDAIWSEEAVSLVDLDSPGGRVKRLLVYLQDAELPLVAYEKVRFLVLSLSA